MWSTHRWCTIRQNAKTRQLDCILHFFICLWQLKFMHESGKNIGLTAYWAASKMSNGSIFIHIKQTNIYPWAKAYWEWERERRKKNRNCILDCFTETNESSEAESWFNAVAWIKKTGHLSICAVEISAANVKDFLCSVEVRKRDLMMPDSIKN